MPSLLDIVQVFPRILEQLVSPLSRAEHCTCNLHEVCITVIVHLLVCRFEERRVLSRICHFLCLYRERGGVTTVIARPKIRKPVIVEVPPSSRPSCTNITDT